MSEGHLNYQGVNYIGSCAKRMNPKGAHVNFASNPMYFTLRLTSEKLSSFLIFTFVALLFYVHGKHLRSCRDGQLT